MMVVVVMLMMVAEMKSERCLFQVMTTCHCWRSWLSFPSHTPARAAWPTLILWPVLWATGLHHTWTHRHGCVPGLHHTWTVRHGCVPVLVVIHSLICYH